MAVIYCSLILHQLSLACTICGRMCGLRAAIRCPLQAFTYFIDGRNITDVFINDLTLAELRTLRCNQKDRFRPQQYNGQFQVRQW